MKIVRSKKIKLNEGDVIEVLNFIGIRNLVLFSVGLEYQADLDKDNISDNLRQKFKDNKILLSQNITISIKEKKWLITDEDNKKTYSVKKEKNKLNIYENLDVNVDGAVNVIIEGWYSVLNKVSVEGLKKMVSQFVDERVKLISEGVKLIPEAKFEDASCEVFKESLKGVVSQFVEEQVKLIAKAKFEKAIIIFK